MADPLQRQALEPLINEAFQQYQAEVERLQAELKIARQERADAVSHANNLRPHTWQQQRQYLVDEVADLQAELAALAEVIAAAREIVATWNNGYWRHHVADLAFALARLDAPTQEPRQQAAERAVQAGIVLPNPEGYQP